MTDLPFRPFAGGATIRRIGEGLLACTLPKAGWTHEAHLGATLWLIRDRPDVDVDAEIAGIIAAYSESVGGVNDDTQGFHDTITRCFVAGIRLHLSGRMPDEPLTDTVNALLASPAGQRDWPLRFYSPQRLFTVAARRAFAPPDLTPLPDVSG
ncbi:hypothetical protein ACVWZA_001129 [Sphingomonas sp. UYAg733]